MRSEGPGRYAAHHVLLPRVGDPAGDREPRLRILYVTQYFPPEVGAAPIRADEMTRHLAEIGHEVVVLTGMPNYPSGRIDPAYRGRMLVRERRGEVDLLRCYLSTHRKRNFLTRLSNYASFTCSALFFGLSLLRGRFDVVLGTSPPPSVALVAWLLSVRFRARFVFDVRDVWPEAARAMGQINKGLMHCLLRRMVDHLYRRAALIVCANPGNDEMVARRLEANAAKIAVVTNGSNTETFHPIARDQQQALRSEHGFGDRFVVAYAGLHGLMYNLQIILDAAAMLRGDDRFLFWFVGDGPRKPELVASAKAAELNNVCFLDPLPPEQLAHGLAVADVGVVSILDSEFFQATFPVKLYDYLACGIPVIHNCGGSARALIEAEQIGLWFPPGDAEALAGHLRWLAEHAEQGRRMGEKGRSLVLERFTRSAQAARYADLLEGL